MRETRSRRNAFRLAWLESRHKATPRSYRNISATAAAAPPSSLPQPHAPIIRLGNFELDSRTFRVKIGAEFVTFSNREFELLEVFAAQPDTVIAASALTQFLWYKEPDERQLSNLRVLVFKIKRKLSLSDPYMLECIRGRGYGLLSRD